MIQLEKVPAQELLKISFLNEVKPWYEQGRKQKHKDGNMIPDDLLENQVKPPHLYVYIYINVMILQYTID